MNVASVSSPIYDPDPSNNMSPPVENPVAPAADLAISKQASNQILHTDELLTYTLQVTNNGPDSADDVVVSDTLPAGSAFVSASTGCLPTGGVVLCNLGHVDVGAIVTVQIVIRATQPGLLLNVAGVSSPVYDPDPSNNTSPPVANRVYPSADLAITKSGLPNPTHNNQPVTYTLVITNNGPDTAEDVVLSDTLPVGCAFVSASSGCGESGGGVTCNLGSLASQSVTRVEIVVLPTATGTLVNVADVSASTFDPDHTNNTTPPVRTQVLPTAGVTITKLSSVNPLYVGEQVLYTLVVNNAGPDAATSVAVTDVVPPELVVDTVQASQGTASVDGSTVTAHLGDMNSGTVAVVSIYATAVAVNPAMTNTAVVDAETYNPTPDDRRSSVTIAVLPSADLAMSKFASMSPAYVGESLLYTLVVNNGGPTTATAAVVTDVIPAGLTIDSVMSSQGTVSVDGSTVTASLGDMSAGTVAVVSIYATPTATSPVLTNSATVGSPTHDPNPENNTDSVTISVLRRTAQLSITKTASPSPAFIGSPVAYTIRVANAGPDTATSAIMTDTLPAEVTFISANSSQGTVSEAGGIVTAALGDIASGGFATVTILATPNDLGVAVNTASVVADQYNPEPDGATVTIETELLPSANLNIQKLASMNPAYVGQSLLYSLVVNNPGPTTATGVAVTDVIPDEMQVTSVQSSRGSVSVDGSTVTAELGDMAVGTVAVVSIFATPTTPTAALTNTAIVGASTHDPDPSDNESSITIAVAPSADLNITKMASVHPAYVGEEFMYAVTVNNAGPTTATLVTAADVIPDGLIINSVYTNIGSVSVDGSTVTANLGDMPAGSVGVVSIYVTPTTTSVALNNVADVASVTFDPNPNNNESSASIAILQRTANLKITKTAQPDPVYEGDNLVYTVTVTNAGPDVATNATVTDALPAGVTFVSATSSQGNGILQWWEGHGSAGPAGPAGAGHSDHHCDDQRLRRH